MSNLKDKYKYSAKFEAVATIVKITENQRQLAIASIDKLSGIFSDNLEDRIESNPDLLHIASNLIELGTANLNDDCVMAEDIVPNADLFKNKYLNLEHSRDNIVGVITDVGFSLLGSNEIVSSEIALNQIDPPAVLNVGGVLWKLVNKELAEITEESSFLKDGKISTSFELLFMSYDIGIGLNGDRKAKNAKIIKPEDPDYEKYSKLLKRNGGTGKTKDGDLVFSILRDILPTGAGIVANPASGIKGVLAVTKTKESIEGGVTKSSEEEVEPLITTEYIFPKEKIQEIAETVNNNIILTESSVTQTNSTNIQINKIMELPKIEKLEDISSKWADLQKNEAAASAVTEFIKQELIKKSQEFAQELAKKDELYKTVEANKAEAEKKIETLESSLAQINKELSEVRAAQAAAEAQEIYSNRMAMLDEEFELDDEDRAILAEEVKTIDSEESFAKYMGKQKKLMAGKKKKAATPFPPKEDKEKEMEDEEDECAKKKCASVDPVAAVASITENANQEISNTPVVQIPLKEQMKAVFTSKTSIGGKKMNKK